jgi:hypothetical protein
MGGGELDSQTSTPGGAEASWIDCGVRKKLGLDLWCGDFPAAVAGRGKTAGGRRLTRPSLFFFSFSYLFLFTSLGWMRLLVLGKIENI